MKWRTEHTTAVGLLIALCLPVLIYLAAYRSANQLAATLGWANRSQEVMLQLNEVRNHMAGAANEQNRYLIQPQPARLAAYRADLAAARSGIAHLRGLAGTNQEQKKLLDSLSAAVEVQASELDQEVAIAAAGRNLEALRRAQADASLARAQAVRDRTAASLAEEQGLLAQVRTVAKQFQRNWLRLFWGACLISLFLLLTVFVMLVREIWGRRRAQEALAFSHQQLEQSWQRYHSLIANVPAAVWTIARDGTTEFISSRVADLIGFSAAEVVTGGVAFWPDLIHPDERRAVVAAFNRLFETGAPLRVEFRLHHKAGHWVWLQAQGQHVYRADAIGGAQSLADGVLYDVSEAKQRAELELAHSALEIRTAEMQRSYRFKNDFLASVSHELRTPLSAILGFSDLLAQGIGGTLNEEQAGFARHIHSSGEHLLALINDILDLSRIEAGAMPLHPELFRLASAADEALETMEALAGQKRIALLAEIEPGLEVFADPMRFRQILLNLLSNAVKFTPEDGRVMILAHREAEWVKITVSDTGTGIASENLQVIFERFQQVNGSQHKGGTGLGLAITQQLVRRQGGEITVESVVGRGSRFIFTMPSSAPAPLKMAQAAIGLQE